MAARTCTALPAGAPRVCGRQATWHIAVGGAVAWLCSQDARQWQGRGRYSEMHTVTDACTTGGCSLAQVA